MRYIDSTHSYVSDHGESYLPVTQLIKRYEPRKDWQEIAEKFAKKHKRTVEDVQAEWKEEGRKAISKGLTYHAKMEQLYVDRGTCTINGESYKVIPSPLIDDVKVAIPLKLEDGVYPEIIVYSDKHKISGQADLIEIVKGKINIKDYKTSKEIRTASYKHWRHGHEMMLPPLGHLMNCNFFQYALQLNIYMALLKTHNKKFKVGDMEILHVVDINSDPIVYEVPNLQKEAKSLLEHYYEAQKFIF